VNPDSVHPEFMQTWNPYALIAVVSVLSTVIGGAIVWISTRGMDRWMKWKEFRRKEMVSDAEIRANQEKSKRLIDKLVEGKNVAEGYRGLLLMYDDRVRISEDRMMQQRQEISNLQLQLMGCKEDHAKAEARCTSLDERCFGLERQCEAFRKTLQQISPGRQDPRPSPLTEQRDKKDERRQ
jgi:hypothetical protein